MAMLNANPVREIWSEGKVAISGWCYIPNAMSAEAFAMLGWDVLTIDMQHGLIEFSDLAAMLPSIEATGARAMVRVPWNDAGLTMKVLDAGVVGVICPMVNNRAECARFVQACRYAPEGYRSFGPLRASRYFYALGEFLSSPAARPVTLAMIETAEALEKIDEIASTPGLDGLYLGPSDLALSMGVGVPGLDRADDFLMEVHHTVIAACRRHGIRAGLNVNDPAYAADMAELGYDLICLQSDMGLMRAAGEGVLAEVRRHARVKNRA